jgi:L-threonylcarbamoyladenylate synthase
MDEKSSPLTNKVRRIDPKDPDPRIINEAVGVMKSGGVIAFPTARLYGLGADAFNARAVLKVFALKRRPMDKALPVIIGHMDQLSRLVKTVPPMATLIIHRFWPGNVTLIFDALPSVPSELSSATGTIAIRMAGHPVAAALVKKMNGPITATSANLTGRTAASAADRIDPELAKHLCLILDAGELGGGVGSTIVDMTREAPVIVREGSVPAQEILFLLNNRPNQL